MSRVDDLLARSRGQTALIGYWPAGYPDKDRSIQAIAKMIEAGLDIVEVGLPYSDPVMDGPTIQIAAGQALAAGFRVEDVFDVVDASASTGTPSVVMTYWNPVERYGVDAFAASLARAGGSGLITPDLIPEEAGAWLDASERHGLNRIFLVAPSSRESRLRTTTETASGFIYATAVMGVTGKRQRTSELAPDLVERVRQVTDKPVGVGLGVSNGEQAGEVAGYADAVIVGSALLRCVLDAPSVDSGLSRLSDFIGELRAGIGR